MTPVQTPEELGAAIRARRKALKLSMDEVARRVGCDMKSIHRLETAQTGQSLRFLFKVLEVLEMRIYVEVEVRDAE